MSREHFYPRPPRGGRPKAAQHVTTFRCISIHALREEGDLNTLAKRATARYFYPRPPRGGRRKFFRNTENSNTNFYPRPPRGGRRSQSVLLPMTTIFLSTPSARRATSIFFCAGSLHTIISIHALREEGDGQKRYGGVFYEISIHALREEGDGSLSVNTSVSFLFLSTPSARRATLLRDVIRRFEIFLSTPSARRATSG